jgi:O-antigen/teichoic acid export membrane protein
MAEERLQEQSLHRLVRFVGVSTLITPAITLGISVVIARALGTEGRGAYGIVVTAVSILPGLLGFGLDFSVRYWSARADINRLQVLQTTTAIGIASGAAGGLLILLCGLRGGPDWLIPSGIGTTGVVSYALIIFVSSLTGMWGNYLSGQERYGFSTFGRNFAMALQALALGGCWLLASVSLEVALLALLLQAAVTFVLFLVLDGRQLLRSLRSRLLPRPELNDMLQYGWWQYLSSMMLQANMRLNIFLLVALQDLHETGLYTAVLGPAGLLWMLVTPLIRVLSVRTTRRADDPAFSARVAGAMRLTFMITLAAGICAAALAPIAIPLLFGNDFADAVEPFWILIPGTIAFSVVRVVVQYLAGAKRPRWNTTIASVGAGVTLIISLLLIPTMGASGAAAATSIAYIASTFVATFAFLRVSKLPLRKLFAFQRSDFSPVARVLGLGSGS